jgi:hypothetical protein
MPSLDQLRPGQRRRIAALTGDDGLVQRLMELGLFEGEDVEVPNRVVVLGETPRPVRQHHRDSEGYDCAPSRDLEVWRDERR